MVQLKDLQNDSDYEDLIDDVKTECTKYGEVRDIQIPRPKNSSNGIGNVFVEFQSVEES